MGKVEKFRGTISDVVGKICSQICQKLESGIGTHEIISYQSILGRCWLTSSSPFEKTKKRAGRHARSTLQVGRWQRLSRGRLERDRIEKLQQSAQCTESLVSLSWGVDDDGLKSSKSVQMFAHQLFGSDATVVDSCIMIAATARGSGGAAAVGSCGAHTGCLA